ncbi:cobalamin ABC transporter [Candidatus Tenderia electrophaga]|mgnify:CR=1 FL=1|jgi:hypothetical protein|uniref:Cobalamin ABC transporter n=1 Tax=Candidatus Tenderia electrophaga TaxID=1748243 RepID=A0A0S2TCM7_9GAMM|nr:cobalamin ABC transporter [Candidatus Tenderia electrophaga]
MTLTTRHQWLIGLGLVLLLIMTRGHHVASVAALPSASWAIFFLAGVYLSSRWAFPALLAGAGLLDFAAVTWGGVSSFCISPAYGFLLPAYGALWLAGRWYARCYSFQWRTLMPLGVSLLGGATLCELLSSGGFYFLSGRFAEPTLAEFGGRLLQYFPGMLTNLLVYVGGAALIHLAVVALRDVVKRHQAAG